MATEAQDLQTEGEAGGNEVRKIIRNYIALSRLC